MPLSQVGPKGSAHSDVSAARILVVGDRGVGKSVSLVKYFCISRGDVAISRYSHQLCMIRNVSDFSERLMWLESTT